MSETKPLEKKNKKTGNRYFRRGKKGSGKNKDGIEGKTGASKPGKDGSNGGTVASNNPMANKDKVNNKSDKSKRRRRRNKKKNVGKNGDEEISGHKLVLRLLPPNLTEEKFWEIVTPALDKLENYEIESSYFVQGEYTNKPFQDPSYSRCYIIFKKFDKLKEAAQKLATVNFMDDKIDSAIARIRISPYNKSISVIPPNRPSRRSIEGTVESDSLFKTFIQSLQIMEEEKNHYEYSEVSLFKSLKKELSKRNELANVMNKRREQALIELAGADNKKDGSKKKKKKKKNKKKKSEKIKESEDTNVNKGPSNVKNKKIRKNKQKGSNSQKENHNNSIEKNNNIVILEAAGKKELQRRKKLQKKNEMELSLNKLASLPSKNVEASSETNKQPSKMKILKRPEN
ncbi:hypothetical protein Kpol_1053p12 [Vanderwaltozyma polyspora DSM 70294]|uniref:UPF3 domain-containing protein n=1 Tax=Vanderwaltozyma polyspora (strain ATCC 22028 / DSM 70294 / BCRC 21397 / CBS 2163 / NBRC 10782 / NRRL Y-8283 / UCD 57-17) TaxID=436907 RepID=A7TN58_VANPO|nr:uncharacterized protein Kpol_1053p12 [Vanderwaltozyma polyspora DSM 70294]EDO16276.1 hypothetical protein Kpol_1053p12 [Vanderwaltozyma polyspora DSM 70294]